MENKSFQVQITVYCDFGVCFYSPATFLLKVYAVFGRIEKFENIWMFHHYEWKPPAGCAYYSSPDQRIRQKTQKTYFSGILGDRTVTLVLILERSENYKSSFASGQCCCRSASENVPFHSDRRNLKPWSSARSAFSKSDVEKPIFRAL